MGEPDGYQSAEDDAIDEQDGYFTDEDSVDTSESGDLFTADFTAAGGDGGDSISEGSPAAPSSEGYSTDPKEAPVQPPTNLHWVRMSSLRIHDNPALAHSMLNVQGRFRCVFILDPWFVSKDGRIGENRCRFLLESLHDLDKSLRAYNSRLYVVQGLPLAVLEDLFHRWNVRQLTFQQEKEPYSHIVEESVRKMAESVGVKVHMFSSHTLYDLAAVLAANGNKPVITQKVFRDVILKLGPAPSPLHGPDVSVSKLLISEEDTEFSHYRIPTMKDLGFEYSTLYSNAWVGGETEALRRLPLYCQLRCQTTENNVDMLFDKSALSPYVRFGCLSVRYFLWKAKWLAKSNPAITHVVKQLSQKLLDRDFYFMVAAQVPNYDGMKNNPICLQLPWERDTGLFSLWREGRTGYPWIDAAMRQLHKEGWIHYHLRESVATFLTSGDLWISWVLGKDVFEELLLDYEPTVSCGLWMRSSCSAYLQGPVPHYCPITFGQKIDPQGQYIRTFCPELRKMPSQYIYSPWLAPLHVQEAANCVIGTHYPHPIVDHATAGALCCERVRSIMQMLHALVPPSPPSSSVNSSSAS